ncbi:glycosyltransferase family 2 protein [Vibrio intestinalis]|uniref:glycosyltransferase family 2 protein n=1 Tax=Vibrio intestinalis TaxID=2933291 RepID=UPI0021A284EC|nr:glycosyltransferase family 2 protein [Vibrio intestinalis]
MKFKYGIVVPHFNSLEGLTRLLNSLPERSDIQVVIVDDKSAQPPCEETLHAAFPHLALQLFDNDSGTKGAGAARNIALQYIDATYTLFADADDFFTQQAFEQMDEKLAQHDITFFSPISQCDLTGEPSDRHHLYANLVSEYLAKGDEEIRYHFSVPWSKVYLSDFIRRESLYFDAVIASNDVMFSLVAGYKAQSIAVHQNSIYCVTRGQGTLTVNFNPKVTRSRFDVAMRRIDYLSNKQIQTETASLYKLVRDFRAVLGTSELKHLFKLLVQRKITLMPKRTWFYLRNPQQIITKLAKRKQSLSSAKYQV